MKAIKYLKLSSENGFKKSSEFITKYIKDISVDVNENENKETKF